MRLFVAINLPPGLRGRLWQAAAPLRAAGRSVKWVGEAQLHLTMRFLGEIADDDLESMRAAIAGAGRHAAPLELRLGGVGAFPSLRRARIVWMGVERSPALEALYSALEEELKAVGISPEERRFHPHVTLGRVRRRTRRSELRQLESAAGSVDFAEICRAETVDLMRSRLGPEGARYEALARCPLGETGPARTDDATPRPSEP